MKTAKDLVTGQDLAAISKTQTVYEAAKLMSDRRIGAVPVIEGDRVVGIFSERDVMNRVVAKNLSPQETRVEEVMTRKLIVAPISEDLEHLLARMKQGNIRHLPIVEEGRLVGIVSFRDLLQTDLDEKDEEIKIMTEYINYVPPTFES